MKIIYNNIIPFRGFKAINLFGVLFAREGATIDLETMNHEKIHTEQMKELLYIFFYLWYIVEYLIRVIQYGNLRKAYRNICFEREAYTNENRMTYIGRRRRFDFIYYIRNRWI